MRPRRASASYGTVNRRIRLTSRETILLALMALVGLWMAVSLVQQIALNRSLSQQANDLRQQNAALQSGNDGHRRDIAAVSSGAAAEEEARLNGYARSDERVYIIASPSPTPGPGSRPAAHKAPPNPLESLWRLVTGAS
jgi:cell division protein FtsB